jgi:hypothetical protein
MWLMTKSNTVSQFTLDLAKENQYGDGTELDWPNGFALLDFLCAHLHHKSPAAIVYAGLD